MTASLFQWNVVNNQLASGSRDYHVKTWDVETGVCVNDYTSPRNIVTCLQYDPTGNLLYQVRMPCRKDLMISLNTNLFVN